MNASRAGGDVHLLQTVDDTTAEEVQPFIWAITCLLLQQARPQAELKTSAKISEHKEARGPFAVRLPQYGDGLFHRRDISVASNEDVFGGIEAVSQKILFVSHLFLRADWTTTVREGSHHLDTEV
ncbi:hypothetical protein CLAIMM_12085 [Cladophialophora immunda]|nr:hypothetical protein CLAIMM_12085 [Cladophialophora immunda]